MNKTKHIDDVICVIKQLVPDCNVLLIDKEQDLYLEIRFTGTEIKHITDCNRILLEFVGYTYAPDLPWYYLDQSYENRNVALYLDEVYFRK